MLRELAPCSCLSGRQWALRPTAWSIHLSKHALGLMGAQPQKYKGGKPQSQAEGAQSCSRDGPGDGVGRSTGGVHMCDGNHRRAWPSLREVGEGWGSGLSSRQPTCKCKGTTASQPETGTESHSLWLFTVHEVTVAGGLAYHARGLDFNRKAVRSH